ncbi:MAG: hypothetical protein P8I29_06185 [Flavobacteriales bacterium]|nr:hypothetical protein [Flavobacteriales bacterium]
MKVVQSQTYDILIGEDSLQNINLSKYSAAAILVDENTKMHCLDIFLSKTQVDSPLIIEILSGETNKNISTCQFIWEKLTSAQFDRNSIIINLGGVLLVIWADLLHPATKEELTISKFPQHYWQW